MTTELTWKEPPEPAGRKPGTGHKYADEAQEMRNNPGRSLLLAQFPLERGSRARSLASDIRTGRYPAFRPGGVFQAQTATEKNDEGEDVVNVYAWFASP